MINRVAARVLAPVYHRLPREVQPPLKRAYYNHVLGRDTPAQVEDAFAEAFFDSRVEYEKYHREFTASEATAIRKDVLTERQDLDGPDRIGDIGLDAGARHYALVRKLRPTTIVETGVGHGFSTLCVLLALAKNDHGHLYSVDYPRTLDVPIEEFQAETYEDYGGSSAIPPNKDPGYIIPEQLRDRWTLIEGKSQRELPHVAADIDADETTLDMFIHDSEHSLSCMLFEFELAWERLRPGGVLLVDDTHWTDAFEAFVAERDVGRYGKTAPDVGYIEKPDAE